MQGVEKNTLGLYLLGVENKENKMNVTFTSYDKAQSTDASLIGKEVHMFEASGLGKAPYKFTYYDDLKGTCQYCGHNLHYRFWLNSADGKTFHVGSDCVLRSGDEGLIKIADAIKAKIAKERALERFKEQVAEVKNLMKEHSGLLSAQPHPYYGLTEKHSLYTSFENSLYWSGKSNIPKLLKRLKEVISNL